MLCLVLLPCEEVGVVFLFLTVRPSQRLYFITVLKYQWVSFEKGKVEVWFSKQIIIIVIVLA